MHIHAVVAFLLWGLLASLSQAAPDGNEAASGKAGAGVPPGAAALGYTKRVINETPTVADIAPGKNGNYKWFSGQWYAQNAPSLDHYGTRSGVLALSLDGDLVSMPRDFSAGRLPLLAGKDGFYVEFDVRLSDNDRDHWPAVWLMPAEHDGKRDHYEGDPAGVERFMELDVDEGGFGPGLAGTVHSTEGVYPKWKHIQNPNNVSSVAIDRSQKHTFWRQLRSGTSESGMVGGRQAANERRFALCAGCCGAAAFLSDHLGSIPGGEEAVFHVRQRRTGLCPAEFAAAGKVMASAWAARTQTSLNSGAE